MRHDIIFDLDLANHLQNELAIIYSSGL